MRITVKRDTFTNECTLGKLYIEGEYICETLEDTDRKLEAGGEKVYGKTAIPRGLYKLIINWSQRFKRYLPILLPVPEFEGIRIHPGNTAADTSGCILVGLHRSGDRAVTHSNAAFDALFKRLQNAQEREEPMRLEVL